MPRSKGLVDIVILLGFKTAPSSCDAIEVMRRISVREPASQDTAMTLRRGRRCVGRRLEKSGASQFGERKLASADERKLSGRLNLARRSYDLRLTHPDVIWDFSSIAQI